MLRIGQFEIHLINAATTYVDGGGAFGLVPRKLWERYFTPDDDNMIPMVLMCLYVKIGGTRLLIDTGLGEKLTEKHRQTWRIDRVDGLRRGLAACGITPNMIDLVIDTHLHGDHCGGNTVYRADGKTLEAAFPNAEYVVQRREYQDAMRPNERTRATYIPDNYHPLVQTGQMRLLDGDTELLKGLWGMVTPGHTPGHMSIRFESQGEHGAFLCDLATYAVHFERLGWMTAYDVEPLVTLETKRVWQQWALQTHAVVMFPHDLYRPAGRLTQNADKQLSLEPLAIPFVS